MPQIAGFRGVLPAPGKIADVVGKPGLLADPAAAAAGTVVRDPGRALYRYHQVFPLGGRTVTRKALVAAIRLAPWAERSIRAHEVTDPAERDAELARITATRTHLAPLLCGFRDAAGEVDHQFRGIDGSRPTHEHTTPDGTVHRLYRSTSAEIFGPIRKAFAPKKLHVLDGHGRYEAMLAYSDALAAKTPLSLYSAGNYALAVLVNLDDITVYAATAPRHRVIRGDGITAASVLAAAKPMFLVDKLAGAAADAARQRAALADSVAHQPTFVLVFAGDPDAYKLTLSPDVSPTMEGVATHRAIQRMDPIVIDELFRPRMLPKSHAVASELDVAAALAAIAKGDAQLAIITRTVPLDQLIHADELNQLLPMHSTAFAPPIDPVVAMPIDPDEDLV